MDYEGWRAHLDEFCRRSSRSQARTVARFESHFEDLRAYADQARTEAAALRARLASFELRLDEFTLPSHERDSPELPTHDRIVRAQLRAARSRSPGPRPVISPQPRGVPCDESAGQASQQEYLPVAPAPGPWPLPATGGEHAAAAQRVLDAL